MEPSKPPPPKRRDDLTLAEGIGPKISELLSNAGIKSFAELAEAESSRLKQILTEGGSRYSIADPTSWPAQARLLSEGRSEEFKEFVAKLKAGRTV